MLSQLIKRALLIVSWAMAAGMLVFVAGCGNKETAMTSAPPPQAAPNVPAAGPALSEKLTFDQLALDSPVKKVQSKQGPTYLHFSYTDSTGKVYKCELPEAQSKGSYLRDEWLRIFGIYRLPTVIKTKAPPTNPLAKGVGDFPFISPRPGATSSGPEQQPQVAEPMQPMQPIQPIQPSQSSRPMETNLEPKEAASRGRGGPVD